LLTEKDNTLGFSLLLISIIIIFFIIVAVLVGVQRIKDDPYKDLSLDEWNCPECGFLVQVGEICIYCGYDKNTNE
tara:strand:- start:4581 stop:4805 length:225 start_codon:yes stop_codon:yes gene_type:complete